MVRLFGLIYCVFLGLIGFGQDFHFTQYDRSMLLLNPSAAGNFDGFERFSAQNRNQWVGAGTQFMTSYAAAEFTLGKNNFDNRSYTGIAVHFNRDVGGDSRFGSNAMGVTQQESLTLLIQRSRALLSVQTLQSCCMTVLPKLTQTAN